MLDRINNIINKKYNVTNGYLHLIELLEMQYDLTLDKKCLNSLNITDMDEDYYKKTSFVAEYVAKDNKIKIYNSNSMRDEELLSSFLHELIHALSSKFINNDGEELLLQGLNMRNSQGIDSYFLGLNEGITQMIANHLTLFDDKKAYQFQTQIASAFCEKLGEVEVVKKYFENDYESLAEMITQSNPSIDVYNFIINIYTFHAGICQNNIGDLNLFNKIMEDIGSFSTGTKFV